MKKHEKLFKVTFEDEVAEFILRETQEISIITALLDGGVEVDARDCEGYSALHYASCENNLEKAKILLNGGADINARDNRYGFTPFILSFLLKHSEMCEFLLENKAERNDGEISEIIAFFEKYQPRNVKLARSLRDFKVRVNREGAL